MKDLVKDTCRVALVQAEPVMFDKAASLEKALKLINEAAAEKPELIVFPELFIPGYPIGMNFGFSMGKRTEAGREDWMKYYNASVVAGETEFKKLAEAAVKAGAYISMGFSERDAVIGTLYNSNVIFEPDGSYKVHRKLKPTGSERVVWGDANKNYFPVTETPWGPMGSLIYDVHSETGDFHPYNSLSKEERANELLWTMEYTTKSKYYGLPKIVDRKSVV